MPTRSSVPVLYKTNNDGAIYRSVDGSRPLVALTFDDGPTSYTSDILDILDSNNAVATFFVCGSLAAARPGLIQRENSLGCEIGNHTYDHTTLTKVSADVIQSELSPEPILLLRAATIGTPTSIMRTSGRRGLMTLSVQLSEDLTCHMVNRYETGSTGTLQRRSQPFATMCAPAEI